MRRSNAIICRIRSLTQDRPPCKTVWTTGSAERFSYPTSNALFCHSPRASRRIPVLFFHAQKVAQIESMNPQRQEGPEKRRDSTRGTRRVCEIIRKHTLVTAHSCDLPP